MMERAASVVSVASAPPDAGPFPRVLLLHGSHGFAQEDVQLAQKLAEGGLLAIAASWF